MHARGRGFWSQFVNALNLKGGRNGTEVKISRAEALKESRFHKLGSGQQSARGESVEEIPHREERRLHQVSALRG